MGQVIPFAGNRWTTVSSSLADSFVQGDRLVVVQETGQLLHIPQAIFELADRAVTQAKLAFAAMGSVTPAEISDFYDSFANNLEDPEIFKRIAAANEEDVDRITSNIKSIVRYNLEREEKEQLFENKVNELKGIFEKQNLKNLKNLKFQLNTNKIELIDDEEEVRPTEVVGSTTE